MRRSSCILATLAPFQCCSSMPLVRRKLNKVFVKGENATWNGSNLIDPLEENQIRNTSLQGGRYCKEPSDALLHYDFQLCKLKDGGWASLLADSRNITSNNNTMSDDDTLVENHRDEGRRVFTEPALQQTITLTGECGPHCRPSCVTLLLDLDKLDSKTGVTCEAASLCKTCKHTRNPATSSCNLTDLYQQHPHCYLEDAKCLGPTVYDDTAAYMQNLLMQNNNATAALLPNLDHCTALPKDDLYSRFHHWNLVTPTQFKCNQQGNTSTCFRDEKKIYFEYCNIVEEVGACGNKECGNNATKVTEPFGVGWTTFVVSASIPFDASLSANESSGSNGDTTVCGPDVLPLAKTTATACFLQRIELFYPPDCPNCHGCPAMSLGDMFGPLELVGFGFHSPCAACDERVNKYFGEVECHDDLLECWDAVDCGTGIDLGLPPFSQNQCSYRTGSPDDDDFISEAGFLDNVSSFDSEDQVEVESNTPTGSPSAALVVEDPNKITLNNSTAKPATGQQDSRSRTTRWKQGARIVIEVASVCFILLVIILCMYWRSRKKAAARKKELDEKRVMVEEEIVYIDPVELSIISKMVDDASNECGSQTGTSSGEDEGVEQEWQLRQVRRSLSLSNHGKNTSTKESRTFRTASIVEMPGKNEVEALYMTGTHIR